MQIFPKKAWFAKLLLLANFLPQSSNIFTWIYLLYFYTDISAKFLHGYTCNIFTRIYFYTDISVIFVTICNSASSRLRFTDLSQLLMDDFTFIFSHFLPTGWHNLGHTSLFSILDLSELLLTLIAYNSFSFKADN